MIPSVFSTDHQSESPRDVWRVIVMSPLNITDVRVRLYNQADDKLKAFATITLDDCFIVSDLKVIQGNNGLFVAMPSRKRKDGKFRDIAHPLNSETRSQIEERVLGLYRELKENGDQDRSDENDDDESHDDGEYGFVQDLHGEDHGEGDDHVVNA